MKRLSSLCLILVCTGCSQDPLEGFATRLRDYKNYDIEAVRAEADNLKRTQGAASILPILQEAIKDQDNDIKIRAMAALAVIGPEAQQATDALLMAVADPDSTVQRRAIEALGAIGPAAAKAVPTLIERLNDKSPFVQREAARSLGKIGDVTSTAPVAAAPPPTTPGKEAKSAPPEPTPAAGSPAKDAVPKLIEALKSDDDELRQNAIVSLGMIGPDAAPAVETLVSLLEDEKLKMNASVRVATISALGKIGAGAAAAVEVLVAALDESAAIVQWTTESLGAIGPAASPAVPKLTAMLVVAPEHHLRRRLAQALVQIDPDGKSWLEPMTKRLTDEKRNTGRAAAARGLYAIGPKAAPALPILMQTIEDPDPSVRRWSMRAVGMIGDNAKDAVPLLVKVLKHSKDVAEREVAAEALGRIGAGAETAIPWLAEALSDGNESLRRTTCEALGQLGSHATPAIPELERLLKSGNDGDRAGAAKALGLIGPTAKRSIPALVANLGYENAAVQQEVRVALFRIDPETAADHGIR